MDNFSPDFLPRRVVDAGYISWLYGPTPEGWNAWNLERYKYKKDLLILDSPRSFRAEYWGDYKANRREDKDPEQVIRKVLVREFRESLFQDWMLDTVLVDGLEADDLVSVLALYAAGPRPFRVIGVDKDYLQLPVDMDMQTIGGHPSNLDKFRSHLQKAVQPWVKEPLDILFTLALLGDQVDNIPRLIPPRRLDMFREVLEPDRVGDRMEKALGMFGEDFTRNVYLAVLPCPWVYDPVPPPWEVLELLTGGTYHTQALQPRIKAKVLGTYYARYPFRTV